MQLADLATPAVCVTLTIVANLLTSYWRTQRDQHRSTADVTLGGMKLTEETLRGLLSRVRLLEVSLADEHDLRLKEKDECAGRLERMSQALQAAEDRADEATRRADQFAARNVDLEKLVQTMRDDVEELNRILRSQASSFTPPGEPR
ncbi:MAG TPA: hypothetical protein VHH11_13805 [Gammaproteobacteria bacterium]|nr:hypothetical protein [Gammaproteobacteria bacterium]